ncbi:PD40 domain-containing protein [candidate division KSB1 bacterium]|nr:PD40 domain-containing protein [candidate division KSB1 bacterium]
MLSSRIKQAKGFLAFLIGMMFILFINQVAYTQGFGKNKVQYRTFDWKFIQSDHFDVYYYDDAKEVAIFTADVAESSYVALKKDFKYKVTNRIPILIYNGHNEFQQTNVTLSDLSESVGGFTEVFKDRVVIPFQGSYKEYRHVLHHELTHAVMFQMFYGGGMGATITGMARFQVPLWLAEGLAEYESLGWDTDSDMYMRDAAINGYVPPIEYMYGFMVYKGGQSVLNYIADKYGEQKISEILGKVRLSRNVNQGIKQSIGIDLEELSERWHKHLRKTYWPDVENRHEPEDLAKRLTDHEKNEHFLNGSPSVSPKGDRIAYLSDRSNYTDIYLMSTVDGRNLGRLVKGQRSNLFEEMHWLRPGMSWSPDGKQLVFAAKASNKDALFFLDVDDRSIISSHKFDLDGVYSPSWSPDGNTIAFMGLKGSQSDIYLFHIESEELEKLTDDIFSDLDPNWSPDGSQIVFISDRQNFFSAPPAGFKMYEHSFEQVDLYNIHVDTREISRLTDTDAEEKSPVFSPDGRQISYISDESGISNIYILSLGENSSRPVTNLLTGVSQLSWSRDGSRLVFSSFSTGGYDLYLINNPIEKTDIEQIELTQTAYMARKTSEPDQSKSRIKPAEQDDSGNNYSNFVFDSKFKRGEMDATEAASQTKEDTTEYKTAAGEYITKNYRLRFTPDVVTGSAGYSQFWGLQGTSMFVLSDILGNHQFSLYTDLFYNIKNSNFQLGYYYLPKKTDFGVSLFHYSYLFYTYFSDGQSLYYGYLRNRNYGLSLYFSRPFNRYRRIDFSVVGLAIDADLVALNPYYYYYGGDYEHDMGNLYKRRTMIFNLGHTMDTVLWGYTSPKNGGRSNLSVNYSPNIFGSNGISFYGAQGDWRKYFRIGRDYSLGVRLASGFSNGRNPQYFLLGGMSNWVNYKYKDTSNDLYLNGKIFFSSFEGPLRGTPFYEMIGTRFALMNLELRFPLIKYLILGGPLRIGFQNIRGVLFMDAGSAWTDNSSWKPFTSQPGGNGPRMADMRSGYGFGARVNMGFLLLRYDLAWKTDLYRTWRKPMHYWSLGADF